MKKFFKAIVIVAVVTLFVASCSKSPTNPSSGGNGGGGGTTPPPTTSAFIEQLKTIDIVKAGDQQWDFKTIKEDTAGKILTVEAINANKSGNLSGLQSYISSKLYDLFQDFKYGLNINPYSGTASDGNGDPQKANSDALEIKITFTDKETNNPVTDPDFKDGFTLKIVANTKWAQTPEITKEDIEASLQKLGNINVTLNFNFSTLTLTPTQQSSYSYETILTVDNSSGKTADLIQFVETVSKADSQTEYLKISHISPNNDDTFDIIFQTVSGDKVFNSSSRIKLMIVGTNPQNPIFNLRDLNVTISGTPTFVTDNSSKAKEAKITINTDAPYLGLQATKIEQLSGTTVDIPQENLYDYVYGSYYPPENVSHIFIDGDLATYLHSVLKDGETIQFKVTFVAFAEGYNPKEGLELTINVTKGQSLPEISLDDFKNWMKISGFTFDFNQGEAILSAESDVTPITALDSIKEGLKVLAQDKIVIKLTGYNSLEDLSWSYPYPTGNTAGTLDIFIKPAEGNVFSQELLYNYLSRDGEYYVLKIKVKPNNTWIPDVSVEGKGKTADNPLDVYVGDGNTASTTPYTLKTTKNIPIKTISVSSVKEVAGDPWNIADTYLFDSPNNAEQKLIMQTLNANTFIISESSILKDASQVYKVTLTVEYDIKNQSSIREEIDLYVKLIKNYFKISSTDMHRIIIYALSGVEYTDIFTPINIKISATATLNIAKSRFTVNSGPEESYFYVGDGSETTGDGSMTYINGPYGLNTADVINRFKSEFDKVGIVWNSNELIFTKVQIPGDQNYRKAKTIIKNYTMKEGYIFEPDVLKYGFGIELNVSGGFGWNDQ